MCSAPVGSPEHSLGFQIGPIRYPLCPCWVPRGAGAHPWPSHTGRLWGQQERAGLPTPQGLAGPGPCALCPPPLYLLLTVVARSLQECEVLVWAGRCAGSRAPAEAPALGRARTGVTGTRAGPCSGCPFSLWAGSVLVTLSTEESLGSSAVIQRLPGTWPGRPPSLLSLPLWVQVVPFAVPAASRRWPRPGKASCYAANLGSLHAISEPPLTFVPRGRDAPSVLYAHYRLTSTSPLATDTASSCCRLMPSPVSD